MKVGSLFSGGGLGDYGLELAGMEIAFQVEIDEYCQKILTLRWPHVPKWRDIRTVDLAALPKVDIVTGGFPCTDISIANNDPKGLAGERSGLWSEQKRIISGLRPKYAIVENVTALFVRGIGDVLGDLASMGYDAEWGVIPASWHGAFHQRERIWILAYPKSLRWETIAFQGRIFKESSQKKPGDWAKFQPINAGDYHIDEQWKAHESLVCGDDDGAPDQVDRLAILGNGQLPQTMCWIGERIMDFERKSNE